MKKSGWILLLVLLCVAFLVSCGKKNPEETEKGELVRLEAVGGTLQPLSEQGEMTGIYSEMIDRSGPDWYNYYCSRSEWHYI